MEFTDEQLEYIKKVLNEELEPLKKDVQENYVPKIVIKKLLEHTKKQKEIFKDKLKLIYLDGITFALEELLKNDWSDKNERNKI